LILGSGVGLILIGVSVGIITLLGGYSFTWSATNAVGSILALAIGATIVEELIFRGLFLQAIEKRLKYEEIALNSDVRIAFLEFYFVSSVFFNTRILFYHLKLYKKTWYFRYNSNFYKGILIIRSTSNPS